MQLPKTYLGMPPVTFLRILLSRCTDKLPSVDDMWLLQVIEVILFGYWRMEIRLCGLDCRTTIASCYCVFVDAYSVYDYCGLFPYVMFAPFT